MIPKRFVVMVQFFTKWVPRPTIMDRSTVDAGVRKSLARMKTEPLDLMQVGLFSERACSAS